MIDINDPDMREIVDEFCNESGELLEHLRDTLDKFEDDPESPKLLEEFGQTVDRIMGASKTLGLEDLGHWQAPVSQTADRPPARYAQYCPPPRYPERDPPPSALDIRPLLTHCDHQRY